MCLIIVTRKPTEISLNMLSSALRINRDGVGAMWYGRDGGVITRKWLDFPYDHLKEWYEAEFLEIAREAEASGSEFALHLRMATHGKTDEAMCHPFYWESPEGGAYLMHNGILFPFTGGVYSDTWNFTRRLEKSFLENAGCSALENFFGEDSAYRDALARAIGEDNKLVIAIPGAPDKCFSIVNRDSGLIYDGHWFSNTYAWSCPSELCFEDEYEGCSGDLEYVLAAGKSLGLDDDTLLENLCYLEEFPKSGLELLSRVPDEFQNPMTRLILEIYQRGDAVSEDEALDLYEQNIGELAVIIMAHAMP
ncbi:hypothetical protein ACJU26_08775 [Acidithiobacillus sp. M4-SHS-6]|uniref:hypothetical protein n=1 Tax=Acidithiobacillus sp. M4-SHS-6 TaxID=3383024 RepID=UPI0039BE8361